MKKGVFILLIGLLFVFGCSHGVEEIKESVSSPVSDVTPVDDPETIEQPLAPEEFDDFISDEDISSLSGSSENIIEMTSDGFVPNSLTINAGDSVKFVNKDSRSYWPASAVHPTHKNYPGSDISKCGSGVIFDACKGLKEGESFTFIFNEKGTWFYHNHLRVGTTGKIIVE